MASTQPLPRAYLYVLIGIGVLLAAALIAAFSLFRQAQGISTPPAQVVARPRPTALPHTATTTTARVPAIRDTDIVFGNRNAKVVLYEYSDLECPFCKQFQTPLHNLLSQYGNDLAVVFRQYPLDIHPAARMEAEVLLCVADQDMTDARALIDLNYQRSASTGTSFTKDQYLDLAVEVGANRTKAASCVADPQTATNLDAEIKEGNDLGVQATPTTFFIAPAKPTEIARIEGAYPQSDIQQTIDFLMP